jgi:hypothetical protein
VGSVDLGLVFSEGLDSFSFRAGYLGLCEG